MQPFLQTHSKGRRSADYYSHHARESSSATTFSRSDIQCRLHKSLYYGGWSPLKQANTEAGYQRLLKERTALSTSTLPLTELSVDMFSGINDLQLGKVDMDYAADLSRKMSISPCSMMIAMVYIERLKTRHPDYLLNVTSSDLFLISMMLSSKFLYDEGVDDELYNSEWADAINVDRAEINDMEMKFLQAIDWHLFVSRRQFEACVTKAEAFIAHRELMRRGSCHQTTATSTYTDLDRLTEYLLSTGQLNPAINQLYNILTLAVCACGVVYTCCTVSVWALGICLLVPQGPPRTPTTTAPLPTNDSTSPHLLHQSDCTDCTRLSAHTTSISHTRPTTANEHVPLMWARREKAKPMSWTAYPRRAMSKPNDRNVVKQAADITDKPPEHVMVDYRPQHLFGILTDFNHRMSAPTSSKYIYSDSVNYFLDSWANVLLAQVYQGTRSADVMSDNNVVI